jgi:streptogramin lyase
LEVPPLKSTRIVVASLLSLLLAASLASSAYAAAIAIPEFALLYGGNGAEQGQFATPWGVATDSVGNVYVTDLGNHRVQVFEADGTFLRMWGWGVDTGSDAFEVCTVTCQAGASGTGNGAFNSPFGIAIDSTDNVYVVDTGNARIQKFDAAGNYVTKWGSYGSEIGQFDSVRGIAISDSDHLFVTEAQNNRVQEFGSGGTFVQMWGWGVDDGTNVLQVCTSTCQAGIAGGGDGQFDYPSPIATAPDGSVYVGSLNTHLISKFDTSGAFISDFGGPGGGDGKFNIPEGLAVSASGRVFVSDYNNHRIQAFGSGGSFLATWGIPGSGDGEFNNPQGLAFGLNGRLSIADGANHRIQVFAPPTTKLSIKAPRSVEKGSVATIRGRLGSSDAACTVGQKVILRTSAGRRLAEGRTTSTGAYALRATLVKTTRVSVRFLGNDECGGSRSAIKTIKVT